MKAIRVKAKREKESSSAFFQKLRPKFLDWRPRTEEEKALDVKARREAREAELKRVTELERARKEKKQAMRKRYRSAAGKSKDGIEVRVPQQPVVSQFEFRLPTRGDAEPLTIGKCRFREARTAGSDPEE